MAEPLRFVVKNSALERVEVPAHSLSLTTDCPHTSRAIPDDLARRFVATGARMVRVLQEVLLYAPSHKPVLLVGATGTGKTTVAELVHAVSSRAGGFFPHTAGELDPNLERSQLFGHERGAFTGASGSQVGWLEEAGEGTLLLDDFHHMRQETQVLLLRALDRGLFRRLGSARDLRVRCRVVIGFGEPLDALVRGGKLLSELFYRLGFRRIVLPSLDERREEIALLALHFLEGAPVETGVAGGPARFAPGVLAMLEAGSYPGNVRELRQIVEVAYERAVGADEIREEHVPELVGAPLAYHRWRRGAPNAQLVEYALRMTGGHVGKTAALLGVHRNTVSRVKAGLGRSAG